MLTFGLFVRHCLPLTLMEYAGRYLYSHADSKVAVPRRGWLPGLCWSSWRWSCRKSFMPGESLVCRKDLETSTISVAIFSLAAISLRIPPAKWLT